MNNELAILNKDNRKFGGNSNYFLPIYVQCNGQNFRGLSEKESFNPIFFLLK